MEFISIKEIETLLKLGAFEFNPTQSKLCLPIIQRIHRKMALGVEFESINVKDNLLINGHHRYICSLLLQKVISTQVWLSPSSIIVYKWEDVQIESDDWESVEIIKRHNRKDAEKSGLSEALFNSDLNTY